MLNPRFTKAWLRFSVLINLLFILGFVAKRVYYSHSDSEIGKAGSRPWTEIYDGGRNSVFQILDIRRGDIVFAGDSETEGFPVTELFHSLNVKSRGIGLNTSSQFLQRLPAILSGEPKKVFVEIGFNDLNTHLPIDTLIAHYEQILDLFEASRSEPYIQSLPPVFRGYQPLSDSVLKANLRIRALCQRRNVPFIDLYPRLNDKALNYDGLHLNGSGYLVWKNTIDSVLNTSAGPRHPDAGRIARSRDSTAKNLLAIH